MVHKTGVFRCPQCPKTFSRVEYVDRHRRLKHLGLRPWSCACGVSYARSDLLNRHQKRCRHPLPPTPPAPLPNPPEPGPPPPSYEQATASCSSVLSFSNPALPRPRVIPSTFDPLPQLPLPSGLGQTTNLAFGPIPANPLLFRDPPLVFSSRPSLGEPDLISRRLYPHLQEETVGESDEHVDEVEPVDPLFLYGSPTSQIVKFSHPQFFITDEPESSPFYLNPQLWVLAFLCQRAQGFTIPRMGDLSKFVRNATEVVLPCIPMIHVPTFRTSSVSIHLGYALSAAGAAFDSSDHAKAFTEQSLSYKRPLVQKDFVDSNNQFDFRFELLQALLTYQYLGIFHRLEPQRKRSHKFTPMIVQDLRMLELTRIVQEAPDYIRLVLDNQLPLEIGWRSWVKYEMHKRTIFMLLISACHSKNCGGLRFEDVDVRLPCHEDVWTASSAEEWLEVIKKHYCWNGSVDVGLGNSQFRRASSAQGGQSAEALLEEILRTRDPGLLWVNPNEGYMVGGEEQVPTLSNMLARLTLTSSNRHLLPDGSTAAHDLQMLQNVSSVPPQVRPIAGNHGPQTSLSLAPGTMQLSDQDLSQPTRDRHYVERDTLAGSETIPFSDLKLGRFARTALVYSRLLLTSLES